MGQKVILGETDLTNYVKAVPTHLAEDKRESMKHLISDLEKDSLNVEQLSIQILKIDFAGYPIIDPSFLSMHNNIDYKGHQIQVPRFSVYKKSKQGFDDFLINIETESRISQHVFGPCTVDYYDINLASSPNFE